MVKIYVVDTNVLIQAPYGLNCFEDNQVILPVVVLEELDNLKKAEGEIGANVRKAIRMLEELRLKGDLLTGVPLSGGGTLRVETNYCDVELPPDLPETKSDNRILKVCLGLSKEKKEQVVLVTKDILLRIKAQITGIRAEDFQTEQVLGREEQYKGRIVFCKHFLDKVAKHFWTLLQVQIGQSCKASTGSYPASRIAIADHI